MLKNFLKKLFRGDARSIKYKKNVIILAFVQSFSMLLGLLLVPLVLEYLGVDEYGVWLTLTTIVTWFSFFDVGIGHGLRNKYAEAKAKDNIVDARLYVSTAFFILTIISILIYIAFLIVAQFIDWSIILAAPKDLAPLLKKLVLVVAGAFCIRFIVNIVCILLIAEQQPATPAIFNLFGNILSLMGVFYLTQVAEANLLYLGICLSLAQILPLLFAAIYLFNTRYRVVAPKIESFSKSHVRPIFSLGLKFFFIQMTALVLFQTNSLIIAHTSGLAEVAEYNIAYKYINVLYILFLTLLNPLWSASTEAYAKGDFEWIKKCMKKLNILWLLTMVFMGIILVMMSPLIYQLWLKGKVLPNESLLLLMLLYFATLTRTSMYRYFMNGVGKIKLQFYVTALQALFHLPLAIVCGRKLGVNGVLLVMIFWNVINMIWEPKQYKKIVNQSANGIWNK